MKYRKSDRMKGFCSVIAGLIAICGLLLAGCDANPFKYQFVGCTIGVLLFAAGLYCIYLLNKGDLPG